MGFINTSSTKPGFWPNGKPKKVVLRAPGWKRKNFGYRPGREPKWATEPPRTEKVNLADLLDWYIASDYIDVSSKTLENAKKYLESFVVFLAGRPFIVKKRGSDELYTQWIAHALQRWAPSTCSLIVFAATGRLCAFLVNRGYMDNNPHQVCRRPVFKGLPTRAPFSDDEYQRLLKAAEGSPFYWAIMCGYNTGMSIVDVCLLQKSDVDMENLFIRKNRKKNNNLSQIPIKPGSDFHEALKAKMELVNENYPNDPASNKYYVDPDMATIMLRGRSNSNALTQTFAGIRNKAGIDKRKSFHNLRATMCSDLANSGVSTVVACSITGHKDPKVFKQYVTPDDEGLRDTMGKAMDHRDKKAQAAAERKEQTI